MRLTGLALATVALCVMIAPPAWADVIPSRQADSDADAGRVQDRLVEVGVSPVRAADLTAALTADELAFFAKDPQSVQVVGGLWLEEWTTGLVFLGGVAAAYVLYVSDPN